MSFEILHLKALWLKNETENLYFYTLIIVKCQKFYKRTGKKKKKDD